MRRKQWPPPSVSADVAPLIAAPQSLPANLAPLVRSAGANLYVANSGDNTVTVYAPGSKKVLRKISQGVSAPVALAFDGSGNLYVANSYSVTVYAPGRTKVLRKTSQGVSAPVALAFGRSGNLCVANRPCVYSCHSSTVTVYAPGSNKVLRTIGVGDPTALAFGPSGNLYVANGNSFDASGKLFVANAPMPGDRTSTVTVYAPGSDKRLRTISQGVKYPDALAFGP